VAEDPGTFIEAYEQHVWDVYGFLGYRLSSRQEAEDLTQATFERALNAWQRYDPERASVRTWLLAIARNLLIDHYRRDRSTRNEPLPDEDTDPAPRGALVVGEDDDRPGLGAALEHALTELSVRERELVALRYGGDLTGPEIAEITGLSVANVHQILSRTLRRLRAELDQESAAG
jgi:RNA polymerase sigma-70 factor (ECF subfamily)